GGKQPIQVQRLGGGCHLFMLQNSFREATTLFDRAHGRFIENFIRLDGQPVKIGSPLDAIDSGIVYLTEDRKGEGLFLDMSVAANVNLATMDRDGRGFGFLNGAKAKSRTLAAIASMRIAVSGPAAKVGSLSGGNQQKVLLARLLQTNPRVLILDE